MTRTLRTLCLLLLLHLGLAAVPLLASAPPAAACSSTDYCE